MNKQMPAIICSMKEIRAKCHRSSSSNATLLALHHGRVIKSSQKPQNAIIARTNELQIIIDPIHRKSQSGRDGTRPYFVDRLPRSSGPSRGEALRFIVFRPASTDRPSGAAIIIRVAQVAAIKEIRTYVHKLVGQIACESLLEA
eukprot:gnl/MRDRNA2_/MRDRNA2_90501_c0_seq1.p2 gnl/MRDRNA2_/MRDRNA2_90501_c0~~gnl/MRDRNA2_/MRDRNA2_90501_c0_seq1.p2  ORF type:complete len:144 (-),score=5.63 gnl/MRDRNA2_/MRDRNA2_90501_c0_seq1:294-725(-)